MSGHGSGFAPGIEITAPMAAEFATMLTPQALAFVAFLQRGFGSRRHALLDTRTSRQTAWDAGHLPDFLPETAHIRADDSWRVDPCPPDLQDRRVEIVGPADRRSVLASLNSSASAFVADFEDFCAPAWTTLIAGQVDLHAAVRRAIAPDQEAGGLSGLNHKHVPLLVRPRGWHLDEKHVLIDGLACSASIFDFGLYFFHNARELIARGSGPYFYLPKLESHLEARLWNDIFCLAQDELGIARGSIKAACLIETLPAAFEMDEILYEMKEHSAGLKVGGRDYIFSAIKRLHVAQDFYLFHCTRQKARTAFLWACGLLLVKTCHKRRAFAIGDMACQIPIVGDPAANEAALAHVRGDMEREASNGFDGTWVAHPGLVAIARTAFDLHMPAPNQTQRQRDDVSVNQHDLLDFGPQGPISESGLRASIRLGIHYLGVWLGGCGCVPINNRMESIASAEVARAQVWQSVRSPKGELAEGPKITAEMVSAIIAQELAGIRDSIGQAGWNAGKFENAARLFERACLDRDFVEFLTLPAGENID